MATAALPLCMSPVLGGPVSDMVTTLLQALTTLHCALTMPSVWPEDYGPTAAVEGLNNYDFVVIGGGIAGSVVASRLSENPDVSVLLLEAGSDPTPESEIPALFFATHRGPSVYDYNTEPQDACLGTKTGTCYWPIPKVMGGLSSIDYVFSLRGNKRKFDEWNLPTWSWEEVTKYYDLSERYQSSRGRLIINEFDQYEDTCHISEMILNGFEELGVSRLKSFVKGNDKVGIGYVKGLIKNGQRMGAGKSYMMPMVKSRPNVHVIKKAEVNKIHFNDKTVSSVTFVLDGVHQMNVGVNKEAIIAAGPIGSAKLLMLSGIGPKDDLTALGIPTVVDLPGVGKHLQDELGVPVPFQQAKFKANPKTFNERQIDTFYYLTQRYGPLTTLGPTPQIGFINGDKSCAFKNCPYPDLNIVQWYSQRNDVPVKMFSNAIGYSDEISQSLEQANRDGNLLLSLVIHQNPKSVGYLELQSADYRDKVKVFPNYLQDERDMESFLQGIKFQMKLENTTAYRQAKAEIIKLHIPGCEHLAFKSDEYWRCYIRHMGSSMYTPSGTTKMGIDSDRQAVVDLRLRVRNCWGLRVAGSSIFVTPVTSSNTDAMVGERLAAFLKEDHAL